MPNKKPNKIHPHECPNTRWVNWLIGSCAAITIVLIIVIAVLGYTVANYFFGIGASNKFNLIENFEVKIEEEIAERLENRLDEEIEKIEINLNDQWENLADSVNPWSEEDDLSTPS